MHSRVELEHKHFESVCNSLERTFTEENLEVERRCREGLDTVNQQVKTMGTDLVSQVAAERTKSTDAISSVEAKLSTACSSLRTDLDNASTSQAKTIEELVGQMKEIHRLA